MSDEDEKLLLKPFELYVENEQKYISYLMKKDSQDCTDFDEKFFLNKNLRIILTEIKKLALDNIKVEIDILYDNVKQKTHEIAIDDIKLIVDNYNDFDNISIVKKRIKENFLKQASTKSILEKILLQTTDSGDLDFKKLARFQDELSDTMLEIQDDNTDLFTFKQIIEDKYTQLMQDRNDGVKGKTLGLSYLDDSITYAGEPGDITTIAMRKGEGKTVLALNIVNALMGLNVPVVYFCLDMGYVTIMDRLLCMRGALNNTEILSKDKDERLTKKIESELNRLLKVDNFLIYPEGSISLKDFEAYILKVRKLFRQSGVLKGDDDYFVCVFDTIDMVEDFSGAGPYEIKAGINRLSTMLKKYNLHAINLNQINENQVRGRKPKTIEDVEKLRFTKEDIEGGSSYASRSRVVIMGTRPLAMKKSFFPEEELLELEEDLMILTIDKQNDGKTGMIYPKLIFDPNTFRLYKSE